MVQVRYTSSGSSRHPKGKQVQRPVFLLSTCSNSKTGIMTVLWFLTVRIMVAFRIQEHLSKAEPAFGSTGSSLCLPSSNSRTQFTSSDPKPHLLKKKTFRETHPMSSPQGSAARPHPSNTGVFSFWSSELWRETSIFQLTTHTVDFSCPLQQNA